MKSHVIHAKMESTFIISSIFSLLFCLYSVSSATIPGGFAKGNTDDPDVVSISRFVEQEISERSNSLERTVLIDILKVSKQVILL